MYVCAHVFDCLLVRKCLSLGICVCLFMCVCVCLCVCVFEREGEKERERNVSRLTQISFAGLSNKFAFLLQAFRCHMTSLHTHSKRKREKGERGARERRERREE